MAPQLKLTYLDIEGRGMATRLAFHVGGIEFEDVRMSFPEFGAAKGSFPLGQVPVLEVDGQVFTQSMALLRYACDLAGLVPKDSLVSFKAQEISEVLTEVQYKLPFHSDEAEKKRLREEYEKTRLNKMLTFIDGKIAAANAAHAVADTVTEADLALAGFVHFMKSGFLDYFDTEMFTQFPAITRAYDAIMALPAVKSYFASLAK
eukprot:m.3361 g.3361  ORF g.3361 m.3361 type:complete len:204 (-) comp5144_c0_seq1:65-676(-)